MPRTFHPLLAMGLIVTAAWFTGPCPAPATEPPQVLPISDEFQNLVSELALLAVPHQYEDTRQWGKQKELVRGLHIRREGLNIKTHRVRREVNHGTWSRYRIELVDPQRGFSVRLSHVHNRPDGGLAVEIDCQARLHVEARVAQWERGVRLLSLSAEAEADVALVMQVDLAIAWDTEEFPPDLLLDPDIRRADLRLANFQLQRISRLHGPLIKELSSSVRELLEAEIARRQDQIVAKLNRQLDKKRERFRISFRDALTSQLPAARPATRQPLRPDAQADL